MLKQVILFLLLLSSLHVFAFSSESSGVSPVFPVEKSVAARSPGFEQKAPEQIFVNKAEEADKRADKKAKAKFLRGHRIKAFSSFIKKSDDFLGECLAGIFEAACTVLVQWLFQAFYEEHPVLASVVLVTLLVGGIVIALVSI